MTSSDSSYTERPRPALVPRWVLVATLLAAAAELAVIAANVERWAVDELPNARSTERRTKREFEVPADATPEQELAILREELAALARRARQRAETLQAMGRTDAQVGAGSYPEQGEKLLDQRRQRLREAEERESARKLEVEARIAELVTRRSSGSNPARATAQMGLAMARESLFS
jgi:hypothetical protein